MPNRIHKPELKPRFSMPAKAFPAPRRGGIFARESCLKPRDEGQNHNVELEDFLLRTADQSRHLDTASLDHPPNETRTNANAFSFSSGPFSASEVSQRQLNAQLGRSGPGRQRPAHEDIFGTLKGEPQSFTPGSAVAGDSDKSKWRQTWSRLWNRLRCW